MFPGKLPLEDYIYSWYTIGFALSIGMILGFRYEFGLWAWAILEQLVIWYSHAYLMSWSSGHLCDSEIPESMCISCHFGIQCFIPLPTVKKKKWKKLKGNKLTVQKENWKQNKTKTNQFYSNCLKAVYSPVPLRVTSNLVLHCLHVPALLSPPRCSWRMSLLAYFADSLFCDRTPRKLGLNKIYGQSWRKKCIMQIKNQPYGYFSPRGQPTEHTWRYSPIAPNFFSVRLTIGRVFH